MTPTALPQSFPTHDWQFWVVTIIFALAILWLARALLPWSKKKRSAKSTRVALTIRGKTPDK